MSDTIIRALELPLHGVESPTATPEQIWTCLRRSWLETADLANWCLRQLLARDVVRLPGMERLPPQPRWQKGGLYALATKTLRLADSGSYWAGQSGSVAAIVKEVSDHWAQKRFAVLWLGKESPPVWRRPAPFPIRGQEWTGAGFDEGGRPWIEVNLPSGEYRKPIKARLRLRGGREFGRQLALFRQIVEGSLPRKQLVIFPRPASNSCHRKRLGGDRVMVKMVACLPRPERRDGRTLVLLTDPAAFWVAELDGRQAWVLNNDHYKSLVFHQQHLTRVQRLGQDRKAERRLGGHTDYIQDRLELACRKHANRMSSWLHESAAHLAGFASRQGVGEVLHLDREKGFLPSFPWHRLHGLLADKLAALGIAFYSESSLRLSGEMAPDELGSVEADIRPTEEDDKWARIAQLREQATGKLVQAKRRKGSHPAVSAP